MDVARPLFGSRVFCTGLAHEAFELREHGRVEPNELKANASARLVGFDVNCLCSDSQRCTGWMLNNQGALLPIAQAEQTGNENAPMAQITLVKCLQHLHTVGSNADLRFWRLRRHDL